MRRLVSAVTGLALLTASVSIAVASSPASDTVAVPAPGGAPVTKTWTGTVPVFVDSGGCDFGANGTTGAGQGAGLTPVSDTHGLSVTAAKGMYADATDSGVLTVSNTNGTDIDLAVFDGNGNLVASGTSGSSTTETATLVDPTTQTYTVVACTGTPGGGAATDYTATMTFTTRSRTVQANPFVIEDNQVGFQTGTVVDPLLFGGEPGIHVDPTTDGSRSYVDWPVSSRTNIGVLFRSEDGTESFQKRYADPTDPTTAGAACSGRQVPICLAGGGGDTNIALDPMTGKVLYTSQVALANEAAGVSNDHGDTFPASQVDTAIGKTVTGVDRQWPGTFAGTSTVFTGFHVPIAGYYLERNDSNGAVGQWYNAKSPVAGAPVDQPNIVGVNQSGAMVIDNTQGIHGIPAERTPGVSRALYVGYLSAGGLTGTVGNGTPNPSCSAGGGFAVGVTLDGGKTFACHTIPGAEQAETFTVLQLDTVGNLYAAWSDGSNNKTYLAVAPADYKRNRTAPGTDWTPRVQVSGAKQNVTIFSNIVAGSPGRVAVGFYGTAADASTPDLVKPGSGGWYPYVSTTDNALCQLAATPCASPTFHESAISNRPNQDDNICTAGTTCAATMGNRNLADYFDITLDRDGHLASVWSDANNGTKEPFVKVARQISGPSLIAGKPAAGVPLHVNGMPDRTGDATYPFYGATARTSPSVKTLDLTGTTVGLRDAKTLEVRVRLAQATGLGTLPTQTTDGTTRLEQARYLTRFEVTAPNGSGRAFYVVATIPRGGTDLSYGAGEVNARQGTTAPGSTAQFGNDYRPQVTDGVKGQVVDGQVVVDVPTAALGSITEGSRLYAVGSYALLGSTDLPNGGQLSPTLFAPPVVVDASPTFDTVLRLDSPLLAPLPGAAPGTPGGRPATTKPPTGTGTRPGVTTPVAAPARPGARPTATTGSGSLASTGLPVGVGLTGLVLLAGAALARPRPRRG